MPFTFNISSAIPQQPGKGVRGRVSTAHLYSMFPPRIFKELAGVITFLIERRNLPALPPRLHQALALLLRTVKQPFSAAANRLAFSSDRRVKKRYESPPRRNEDAERIV